MKKIAIVGASGHGKVVADLAELCGFEVAFFDDAYPEKKSIEHWPVLGDFKDLLKTNDVLKNAIVAVGNNNIRTKLSKHLIENGFHLPVLIHPKATISKYAKIDLGSVVFANAVINAFAKIGRYSIINSSATVEHEATTSKISEDQIFYLQSRGLDAEKAMSLIVNGFCADVFKTLPLEFSVEAVKLIEMKLENTVG